MKIWWRVGTIIAAVLTAAGCANGGATNSGTSLTSSSAAHTPTVSRSKLIGQAWSLPPGSFTAKVRNAPPLSDVTSVDEIALGLDAAGNVWAIQYIPQTKRVATASRVVGLSNVRKISGSGETGDPTWYALRTDGTVVQGTILQGKTDTDPVSARVVGNLPLHFSDVTDIVTEGGPWVLRSDGTIWFIYIPIDGHSGPSISPKGAQATPIQGLTDVTHLWGGIGSNKPVVETKSGKLFELDSGADRRTPVANALQAPDSVVVQMQGLRDTWVALDRQHHLWYWSAGVQKDDISLVGRAPKRLVGPTASDHLATGCDSVFGADHSVWGIGIGDDGQIDVTDITGSLLQSLPELATHQVVSASDGLGCIIILG